MSTEPDMLSTMQKAFLSAPRYAVVGASKDPNKWGTKVRRFLLFFMNRSIKKIVFVINC
jgi:predicted CoA-binding protein